MTPKRRWRRQQTYLGTRKRPRWLVPAAAVLVLASVGLGSVSMFEQVAPGKVTDRLSALRAAATGAWSRVMEETEWMREAAAEDLSNVVDKVKAVTSEVKDAANERLGDDGDTPSDTDPAGEGPRVSKRRRRSLATAGHGSRGSALCASGEQECGSGCDSDRACGRRGCLRGRRG